MEKINDDQLKMEFGFDLYGRYAIIRDTINKNRKQGDVFRVLDVGGRGNILKKFLPEDQVFFLDPFVDSDDENFIKGDGCAMPLKEESFDWVTSADVFEHIPQEKRKIFLEENVRVAKLGVILAAPFHSLDVMQAEMQVNENHKLLHNGEGHIWLKEHIENGLPEAADLENFLKERNLKFQELNNNRLFLWQILQEINLLLAGQFSSTAKKELEDFNYFYNTQVFPIDDQKPSYRKIYFIKKNTELKDLETSQGPIKDELLLDITNRVSNLFTFITIENRNLISQKADELESSSKEILQKDQEISFIKSSKFWKIREQYLKIKGK